MLWALNVATGSIAEGSCQLFSVGPLTAPPPLGCKKSSADSCICFGACGVQSVRTREKHELKVDASDLQSFLWIGIVLSCSPGGKAMPSSNDMTSETPVVLTH